MAGSDVTDKASTTVRDATARHAEPPDGDSESAEAAFVRNDAAERIERRPAFGEITLRSLVLTLFRGAWLLVAVVLLCVLAAGLNLKLGEPSYTASLVVAPAPRDLAAASRLSSRLDEYAEFASLAQTPTRMEAVSTIDLYQEVLTSPQLAERVQAEHPEVMHRVFREQWDAQSGTWHPEPGVVSAAQRAVLRFFGYPGWEPPTPANLAEYLERRVGVAHSERTELRRVNFEHPDPAFATRLIRLLHDTADTLLREDAERQLEAQVGELEQQLGQANELARQEALRAMLAGQYRVQALLRADAAYAAQIVTPPSASPGPTSTSPLLVLALAAVVGVILGVFAVFLVDALRKGA
jgi:capsular polysaccharide biosynthesis protein